MQLVQQKPLHLVPEESRSKFENEVFDIYEQAVMAQNGWFRPEPIPLLSVITDQAGESFREIISLIEFGNRFAWFNLPDIEKWQTDTVDKYATDFQDDLFNTILRYQMSFYSENKGYVNLPCGKVW